MLKEIFNKTKIDDNEIWLSPPFSKGEKAAVLTYFNYFPSLKKHEVARPFLRRNQAKQIEPKKSKKIYVGKRCFMLSEKLFHLEKAFQQLEKVYYLQESWDGDSALPFNTNLVDFIVDFLYDYSKYIFEEYGLIIEKPDVNPLYDGTLDLSWKTESAGMLINFQENKSGFIGRVYGELSTNKSPIETFVDGESFLSETLAVWMKFLSR